MLEVSVVVFLLQGYLTSGREVSTDALTHTCPSSLQQTHAKIDASYYFIFTFEPWQVLERF